MNSENLIGQTLDGKYMIESEIGKGGMGTVYLSTHIGTERTVAVKVIATEFMKRAEFVERFRREARAAGRLRHPNVVNVTDFGFSQTEQGRVAYLVMEYLDGCTLGEVLDEEQRLSLQWSLDILEQVCSAVQEAHSHGIVHRDLKPDNIWLEPNQRGGYTVKVLDFGIAKLEVASAEGFRAGDSFEKLPDGARQTMAIEQGETFSDSSQSQTINDRKASTIVLEKQTLIENNAFKVAANEAGTMIQPAAQLDTEGGTKILDNAATNLFQDEDEGTKILSTELETSPDELRKKDTSELTRVGAVLGTPLYMSPEQCRGDKLTASSDIYSLGVIAYQMLSGKPPFTGDYLAVMESHKTQPPPPIEAKKIPKKVKNVISAALQKETVNRPASAEAFASELRSQSEGIGVLLQRSLVIYSQYLPKFLTLSVFVYLPVVIVTLLQVGVNILQATGAMSEIAIMVMKVLLGLAVTFSGFFCAYIMLGTTSWMVTQILAAPLRPVELRPALQAVKTKWKTLFSTGLLSTVLTLLGYSLCLVPGLIISVIWSLVSPVVMMEDIRGKAALKRSKQLVMRSLRTTTAAVVLMFIVPIAGAGIVSFIASASIRAFDRPPMVVKKSDNPSDANTKPSDTNTNTAAQKTEPDIQINVGNGRKEVVFSTDSAVTSPESRDMSRQIRGAIQDALSQILLLPFTILLTPFSSIIVGLLYLKTRLTGGESMQDLLTQFEAAEQPRKKWQERVRGRLMQSGRVTSKP